MKVILILIAIVFGMIGLLMSACGLFFTIGAFNYVALISLIVGVALCWVATLLWKAGNKSGDAPTGGGSTGAGSG